MPEVRCLEQRTARDLGGAPYGAGMTVPLAEPLADLVRVEDLSFYDDRQFGVYNRMRIEAPAYHYPPVDFVDAIAAELPLYVAAALMGVTEVDIPRMKTWVAALEDLTRVTSADDLEEPGQRFDELKRFLRDQLELKRRVPGKDMISAFLASTLDGSPPSDAIVLAHVATLMSNGGTTRLLLSSVAPLLAGGHGQLELIRADPGLLDGLIEECLRLIPPARGFVRTATADVDLPR